MSFLSLLMGLGTTARKQQAGSYGQEGFGGVGGGAGGAGDKFQRLLGSKGPKLLKSAIDDPKAMLKTAGSQLKKVTGIGFSISSLLRQSQIFTGFVGAIFQIVGAFVDVLLAPMAPFLFGVISWVAKTIIPFASKNGPVVMSILTLIGLAIAGVLGWPVALAAAAGILIWTFRDEIIAFLTIAWKTTTIALKIMWNAFLTPFKKMGDNINPIYWIKQAWSWLGKATNWWSGPLHKFTELWKDITEFAGKIKDKIVDIWNDNITPFFDNLWETISGWWNTITTEAGKIWKFITDFPKTIKDKAIEVWAMITAWWESTIKPIFSPILDWFSNTLQTGWTKLVNFISAIGKGIVLVAKTIIHFVVEKFVAVITWLRGFPTTLANGIKDLWNGITEFFGGVLDPVINFFKTIFTKIWKNVQSVLEFFNRGEFLGIGKGKLGTQIGTIEGIIGDLKKQTEQQKVQVILTQTIGGANGTTKTTQDSYIAARNSLANQMNAIELEMEVAREEIAPVAR